jgi:epoxyqueuosine reductase
MEGNAGRDHARERLRRPPPAKPPPAEPSPEQRGSAQLEEQLKARALEVGFSLVGVTSRTRSVHMDFYRAWVDEALHGEMAYLAREDAVARRADLSGTLESVQSVLVVAHEYFTPDAEGVPDDPSLGVIARYARGADYHRVVKKKLNELLAWMVERTEGRVQGRAYVDTGPILERELAQRAGLGWFGRNTMLINPSRGSYFFLGVLLLDLELPPDEPFTADRCGSCHACLDACPTGALLGRDEHGAPLIDARRCISYLTIELRGPIPHELRPAIGNRVYGCDICQEVCPFNRSFARETEEPRYAARGPGERPAGVEALGGEEVTAEALGGAPAVRTRARRDIGAHGDICAHGAADVDVSGETPAASKPSHPGTQAPPLIDLMGMDEAAWDSFSRASAIRRAGYAGFRRNVAVALGNWGSPEAVPALLAALADREPLVRGHAAWALGRIASEEGRRAVQERRKAETDPYVLSELDRALPS